LGGDVELEFVGADAPDAGVRTLTIVVCFDVFEHGRLESFQAGPGVLVDEFLFDGGVE
jgi:hypothetical protein